MSKGSLADLFDEEALDKELIKQQIRQRRAQMLVHSCIYYEMNDNIVSDHQWQEWAEELAKLQNENPDCCTIKYFDREFKDWDGTTGAMLPYRHPQIFAKAEWLVKYHNDQKSKDVDFVTK